MVLFNLIISHVTLEFRLHLLSLALLVPLVEMCALYKNSIVPLSYWALLAILKVLLYQPMRMDSHELLHR